MKPIAAAFLGLAILCHSGLAVAADPIPFAELAKTAGAYPAAIPLPDASQEPTAAPAQSAAPSHGGKIMMGVGIAFLGVGAALIGVGASVNPNAIHGSETRNIAFGAGGAAAGTGVVLIVLGARHHPAK